MRSGMAFAATVLAVLALGHGQARAQPEEEGEEMEQAMSGGGMTQERQLDDERARVHFRTAAELYDRGEFERAAVQFEEAYRLSGRSELLYNAYIAYREANDRRLAAAMLERYLQETPDAADRANLERRLEELQEAIQREDARAEALEEAERRAAEEAQRAEVQARLAEERGRELRRAEVWPWVVLGIGGAITVAGLITGAVALGRSNNLRSACPEQMCPPDSNFESRRSDIKRLSRIADGLIWGGLTVAVVGFISVLAVGLPRGGEDQAEAAQAALTPDVACGPTGCVAGLRGSFF